jgi:8-oxo-dGTP pyrophosphatase MutT (NUDIX family)
MNEKTTLKNIIDIYGDRTPGAAGKHKYFSVLVPLVEKEGQLYLLYQLRAAHMKRQPGEVCFPGGKVEPGESLQQCAVRETVEELGILESDIKVINQMDVMHTYSNFTLFPFLGTIKAEALDRLNCNPDEVEEVFLVPLDHLIENDPFLYKMQIAPLIKEDFPYEKIKFPKTYKWRYRTNDIPIYEYENRIIWGLTGRVTMNLIEVLKGREDRNV